MWKLKSKVVPVVMGELGAENQCKLYVSCKLEDGLQQIPDTTPEVQKSAVS